MIRITLPPYPEVIHIMGTHGLQSLTTDRFAYLEREYKQHLALLVSMQYHGKFTADQITGMVFIIGLMLQAPDGGN
jgi:hypothetical protein